LGSAKPKRYLDKTRTYVRPLPQKKRDDNKKEKEERERGGRERLLPAEVAALVLNDCQQRLSQSFISTDAITDVQVLIKEDRSLHETVVYMN